MKRKRLTALLLAAALGLSGCGSAEEMQQKLADMVGASKTVTPGTTISADSKWINSDIIGAIDENTPLREQDDFFTAVNRENILKADTGSLETGESIGTLYISDQVLLDRQMQLMTLPEDNVDGLDEKVMSADQLRHLQQLVQTLYQEAADIDLRNQRGVEPLRPYLEDIERISSLEELTAYFCDVGGANVSDLSLLPLSISRPQSEEDPEKYMARVSARTMLTLADYASYYDGISLEEKTGSEEIVKYALGKLGYGKAEIQNILKRCYRFEIKLARHMPSISKTDGSSNRDEINVTPQNSTYDLEGLKALAGNYPIETLLTAAGLADSEIFLVEEPDQVKNVGTLYTEANLEDIKSYLLVQLVRSNVDFLDETIYNMGQTLKAESDRARLDGQTDEEEEDNAGEASGTAAAADVNSTALASYVMEYLRDAYEEIYVGHYCDAETKEGLTKLTLQMMDGFRQVLLQADWMSEETREKALDKLDNMGVHVLYPDKMVDFSSLSFEGCSSLVEIMGRIYAFRQGQLKAYVNQPLNPQNWDLTQIPTAISNAAYMPTENTINICAGFLCTDDVYDPDATIEYNMGRMGTIIGHEISHGFDTSGYSFNRIGLQKDWWTRADRENFELRSRELVKYYDAMTPLPDSEATCNGSQLSGEAIADMGGMKAALLAAKELPDFDYASFFRNYAELWFVQRSYYDEYTLMSKDPHPLAFLRTNVILQQFDEFRDTFGIQPGDGMYLADEDRIAVW